MGAGLILAFLKTNWKPLIILGMILALGGYIQFLRVDLHHYQKKYNETQLALDTLVKTSKEKQDALAADSAAITAKYRGTLKSANDLIVVNAKLNEENIKNATELRNVKLSLNAIRLFNASKQSTTEENSTPPAVSGNAPTPGTAKEAPNLKDLLLVVNDNDKEHLKCIKQVEEWQKLWGDVNATVQKYNATN